MQTKQRKPVSIETLVKKYTVCGSLEELCDFGTGGYRPSLYGNRELSRLADAYDARQAARGDKRRAFRG